MAVKIGKINKSVGSLLKNPKNLQLLTGSDKFAGQKLALENDICCGLGRKTLYFAKSEGVPTKIKKYPVILDGNKYWNRKELEQALTEYFGVGYIVYIPNAGNVVVLSSPYKKSANGTLEDISDFIPIS